MGGLKNDGSEVLGGMDATSGVKEVGGILACYGLGAGVKWGGRGGG